MTETSLVDVVARLDDLLKEVRRQGRAAIAAQAAAESCLEAIREGADAAPDEDEVPSGAPDDGEAPLRWLRALLPVADAVDRVAAQATALEAPRPPAPRTVFRRLLGGAEPAADPRAAALAEGLRVLKLQLEGALRDLGVQVDRRTGDPVDGELQRVVEVRAPGSFERAGTVVEVVRPGYSLGGRVVREAEVVVAASDAPRGRIGEG